MGRCGISPPSRIHSPILCDEDEEDDDDDDYVVDDDVDDIDDSGDRKAAGSITKSSTGL